MLLQLCGDAGRLVLSDLAVEGAGVAEGFVGFDGVCLDGTDISVECLGGSRSDVLCGLGLVGAGDFGGFVGALISSTDPVLCPKADDRVDDCVGETGRRDRDTGDRLCSSGLIEDLDLGRLRRRLVRLYP